MNELPARKAIFIYSPDLDKFPYPPDCPFRSERAGLTRKTLLPMGLLSGPGRSELVPKHAPRAVLEKFHAQHYLDLLEHASLGHLDVAGLRAGLGTPDCPVYRGLYESAALATGATLDGAQLLLDGSAHAAFNPAGGFHHAFPDRAAGFCYMNDVALACLILAGHGRRVFYLDIDVHHADGVQFAFNNRSDVMTVSFHESGRFLFPGTGFEDDIGAGPGRGYAVNVPLPPGTYDEQYLKAFRSIALPLLAAFDPDVIVFELGMDGLAGDPLAHLSLTNNTHAEVVTALVRTGKPLLVTGGGGYHVGNTVRGWALAWSILCGEDGDDAQAGLGGVFLGTTDWHGGLRDPVLVPSAEQKSSVPPAVDATIKAVKGNVFPIHGLPIDGDG